MTEQEINEGKRLIAEFEDHPFLKIWREQQRFPYYKLKYTSDWNSMVPVVKKIHTIFNNGVAGYSDGNILDALIKLDIDGLFIAVVEFIQWYNENKE